LAWPPASRCAPENEGRSTTGSDSWIGDAEALACCERIGAALRAEPWDAIAAGLRITASVGVAVAFPPGIGRERSRSGLSPALLYRAADDALYAAKRAGSGLQVGRRTDQDHVLLRGLPGSG